MSDVWAREVRELVDSIPHSSIVAEITTDLVLDDLPVAL
jgi:hypothetical protein